MLEKRIRLAIRRFRWMRWVVFHHGLAWDWVVSWFYIGYLMEWIGLFIPK